MNPPYVPAPPRGPNGVVVAIGLLFFSFVLAVVTKSEVVILALWAMDVLAMAAGLAMLEDRRSSWTDGLLLMLPGPVYLFALSGVPG